MIFKLESFLISSIFSSAGRGHHCDLDHLHISDIHALPDVPGPVAE